MIAFALILACCLIAQWVLPWWIIGVVSFGISAWFSTSSKAAFRAGFWAVFILWLAACLFKTIPNQNILANRVGQMFMLPDLKFNWIIVMFVTCLLGGLVAGFSALAGFHTRQLLPAKQTLPDKK